MAYTDDAVLAKLSALNETHDSIATAAQWIMFHRRHAERTVQLWFQRLKDSPSPKRLNLIYLANEVTQQSKARHKEDFVVAFSPVIAEAIAAAYKGAPTEVQNKLRRVVEVWRDRSIFEIPIQTAVETRIEELDKAKGTTRPSGTGSIFGSHSAASSVAAVPQELASLIAPQQKATKLVPSTQTAVSKAQTDYDKVINGPTPALPVYAARLNGLLRALTDAENSMQQLVQARTELKKALDTLQAQCQTALDADTKQLQELQERKRTVDTTKQEVEDRILSSLNGRNADAAAADGARGLPGMLGGVGGIPEPPRPEVEALTPPGDEPDEPVYATEPPAAVPVTELAQEASQIPVLPPFVAQTSSVSPPPASIQSNGSGSDSGLPGLTLQQPVRPPQPPISSVSGIEILSHLASQAVPVSTNGVNKRRRVEAVDEVPDLDDGIDADVAETLRQDSMGA